MTKIEKKKHIGIYIHHQNKEHWDRVKELLPYFSCKISVLSSLDIRKHLPEECDFIKLPCAKDASYPEQAPACERRKKRMNIVFNFVYQEAPDLFYIEGSTEMAAFINLLGTPFVYARRKGEPKDDYGQRLAYGLSLFNIAPYDNSSEEDWYKKTPFYHKTKYHLRDQQEVNKKLFCMYLEDEFFLKREKLAAASLFHVCN